VCRVRLWNVRVFTVDPFFPSKRHPLYAKPLNLFPAHDAGDGHAHHSILSGSPDHEHAVLAVEPARKVVRSKPLFSAHVQELPYESALGAAVAVIVHELRLVRLLIPCCQSCTCNKKQSGSSFTLVFSYFLFVKTQRRRYISSSSQSTEAVYVIFGK